MVDETNSLSLPLRAPQTRKSDTGSIRFALTQINAQYGSFRNVTEESLKAEIASSNRSNQGNDPENSETDEEEAEDEDTVEDHDKKAEQARDEILKLSTIAQIEAFSALEFLSFLLSKYNPAQAKSTLSKEAQEKFKQLGTLEAKHIIRKEGSADARRTIEEASRGYKMDAFRSSSESLLEVSSRLREEANAETRYWEGVVSLKAKGWAVSRIPGKKDVWGVHFGSAESRPMFRDRGIAILKKALDGGLELDFGGAPPKPKSLRIEIFDRIGHVTSRSKLKTVPSADTENDLQRQVSLARNSLFEEELFLEIHREATALASYDVKTSPGAVTFPLGPDYEGRISLANLESESEIDLETDNLQIKQDIDSNLIALVLRLLLSHAHRQNLKRRSEPPPPMSSKPRSTPEYHLIRPTFAYFEHKHILALTQELLVGLAAPCRIAGIPFSFHGSFLDHLVLPEPNTSALAADKWLKGLISEPLMTTISLQFPSSQKFEVKIRTEAAPPVFGTEYSIISPLPQYTFPLANRGAPRLSNLHELGGFLTQSLSYDVLSWMQSNSRPLHSDFQADESTNRKVKEDVDVMDGEESTPFSTQASNLVPVEWEVLDAADGCLISKPPRYNLALHIQPKRIHCQLDVLQSEDLEPRLEHRQAYLWSSIKGGVGGREDSLEKLSKGRRSRLHMRPLTEIVADFVGEKE